MRSTIALLAACAANVALGHGTAASEPASARFIEFPDTADAVTLVVDLHTHSVFSDGHVWPSVRVQEAVKDGLDALAITEHLEYQPHKADIPHPDRNRAYVIAAQAAEPTDLIVIAGSEITREAPAGHINAVFVRNANELLRAPEPAPGPYDVLAYYEAANAWPAEEALQAAIAQGAFLFWNHPYWTRQAPDGIARVSDFHRAAIDAGHIHGIEIANGQDYSEEAHAIALAHDLALIGVSDVHDLVDWDYAPEGGGHRPVTLVLAKARTSDAIRQALFEKRTVVWFRNLLIGREAELSALLDASLDARASGWMGDSDVLEVTLTNVSDAVLNLRNLTENTFMHSGDRVDVPAHGSVVVAVKRPNPGKELTLRFEVENALLAPKRAAQISFVVEVPPKG